MESRKGHRWNFSTLDAIHLRQGLSLYLETAGGQEAPVILMSLPSFHWCFRFLVTHMAFFNWMLGIWTLVLMLAQQALFTC